MAKLYIFVGVYDGIADEISLHLTEEAAEAAYTKYTGVPYVNPLTDQSNADPNTVTEPEISEHVNASTIEDVDIGCELARGTATPTTQLSAVQSAGTRKSSSNSHTGTRSSRSRWRRSLGSRSDSLTGTCTNSRRRGIPDRDMVQRNRKRGQVR